MLGPPYAHALRRPGVARLLAPTLLAGIPDAIAGTAIVVAARSVAGAYSAAGRAAGPFVAVTAGSARPAGAEPPATPWACPLRAAGTPRPAHPARCARPGSGYCWSPLPATGLPPGSSTWRWWPSPPRTGEHPGPGSWWRSGASAAWPA